MLVFKVNRTAIFDLIFQFRSVKPVRKETSAPLARPVGVLSTALPNGEVHEHLTRTIEEATRISEAYRRGAPSLKKVRS